MAEVESGPVALRSAGIPDDDDYEGPYDQGPPTDRGAQRTEARMMALVIVAVAVVCLLWHASDQRAKVDIEKARHPKQQVWVLPGDGTLPPAQGQ